MVQKTYDRKRRCLGGVKPSFEDRENRNRSIESPPPTDSPTFSSSPGQQPDIKDLFATEKHLLSPKSSPPPPKREPLRVISTEGGRSNGQHINQLKSAIRVRQPPLMAQTSLRRFSNDGVEKDQKIRSKRKRKLPEPTLLQTTLSLGQVTQTTCRTCGMSYQVAVDIDAKAHKSFHSRAVSGYPWPSTKKDSLFPVTKHTISSNSPLKNIKGTAEPITLDPFNDYVAEISYSSAMAFKRATVSLIEFIDMELSAPSPRGLERWSKHSPNSRIKDSNAHPDYKAFIYVHCKNNQGTAIACVLVHPAESAYFMHSRTGQLLELKSPDIPKNKLAVSSAVMAVSRIYTAHAYRNNGIAKLLLNIACDKFIFGIRVKPSQVAWSQPSASGAALAQKWSGLSKVQVAVLLSNNDECIINQVDQDDDDDNERLWLRVYIEE